MLSPTRHQTYYFKGNFIIFQVEGHLYRVHDHFFIDNSPVFRDMFSLPMLIPDGKSDDAPLFLAGVRSIDFERLITMFYNPARTRYKYEEWRSILGLADLWQMDTIRARAIEALGRLPINAVDKVVLWQQYSLEAEWGPKAFDSLCNRTWPLTIAEESKMGSRLSSAVKEAQTLKSAQAGVGLIFILALLLTLLFRK